MIFGKNSSFVSTIDWHDNSNFDLIDSGQQNKQRREYIYIYIYKEWSKFSYQHFRQ